MQTLHRRIKSTRLDQNLSQSELAQKTGVSQPTVANWENGSHIPRKNALEKISSALGVESDWLLSGDYAKAHNSVADYLARPIRHVPIYKWPNANDTIFNTAPEGYLTYPSETSTVFALVSKPPHEESHKIWIFDQSLTSATNTSILLWSNQDGWALGKHNEKPTGAEPVGQLKAEVTTY